MTIPEPSARPPEQPSVVEARITRKLTELARARKLAGRALPPPPYIRRHLVEHAAAGEVLDGGILTADFLLYLDAARLRALTSAVSGGRANAPALTGVSPYGASLELGVAFA